MHVHGAGIESGEFSQVPQDVQVEFSAVFEAESDCGRAEEA